MPVGMEIRNNGNIIQITSDTLNYSLKYKGTVTPSAGSWYTYEARIVAENVQYPIAAFRSTNTSQTISVFRRTQIAANTYQFTFRCTNTSPITYYIFDSFSTNPINYGLEIRDPAQNRVFHIGAGSMLIAQVGTSFSGLDSSREYAVAQTRHAPSRTITGTAPEVPFAFNVNNLLYGVRFTSSTSIQTVNSSVNQYLTNTAPSLPFSSDPPTCLLIDVTGMEAPAGLIGSGDPTDIITTKNWPNISSSTPTGSSSAVVDDIGTQIELDAVISDYDVTLDVRRNGVSVGTPVLVQPDDTISFNLSNPIASAKSGTVQVINLTHASQVVDTITYSLAAYVVPDITINAVNWNNISGTSPAQTNTQTITGINVPITMSITRTGNASNILTVYVNGSSVGALGSGGANTLEFTVSNGSTVYFVHNRLGATGTTSGTATVRNVSDGNVVVDTYTYSVSAGG